MIKRQKSLTLRALLLLAALTTSCGPSGPKSDYILAEKLWQEGSFESSARQFEKVFQKDPKGPLGQQSLYRAATTQLLFLRNYAKALGLFSKYLKEVPRGLAAYDARAQIGDIYFSKTGQYIEAVEHYQNWLKEEPGLRDRAEFLFRIGRAQFLLRQFGRSLNTYQKLLQEKPSEKLAAEATYQQGMIYLSQAAQQKSLIPEETQDESEESLLSPEQLHRRAVLLFEQVEKTYPQLSVAAEASLGIATSLEERGAWEDALRKLLSLQSQYPIPQVIQIRVHRIQERLTKRTSNPKR